MFNSVGRVFAFRTPFRKLHLKRKRSCILAAKEHPRQSTYIVDTLLSNLFCSPYILELHFSFGISLILSVSNTDDCTCLLEGEGDQMGDVPGKDICSLGKVSRVGRWHHSPLPCRKPQSTGYLQGVRDCLRSYDWCLLF